MDGANWQRVLSGRTFDDQPYQIALESDVPFGHGGSAEIYKGVLLGAEPIVVAVKLFREYGLIPRDSNKREELLNRELRAASKVSGRHASILAFLGTAYRGQQRAIVSRYMQNGNLLQYLKSKPCSNKQKLIVQVAQAVNYLHSAEHLVHGDLKCENVLISDHGDALLADFGLSRFLDVVHSGQTTMTGIRQMYTIHFAAPELLASLEEDSQTEEEDSQTDEEARYSMKPPPKTCESDVYAFGMLILEAVTEEPPWSRNLKKVPQETQGLAIMKRVLKGTRPSQPTSRSGLVSLSHPWWDVCKRCWTHTPSLRPCMPFILDVLENTALEPYRQLEGHTNSVWCVAYFPDRRRVASASFDRSIRIWDALTGQTVTGPLYCGTKPVFSVAVSPDGRQICSGDGGGTVLLWDADSGALLCAPMTGHHASVNGVAFAPDGTRIASGSDDLTVRLWNGTTGEALGDPLDGHTACIWCVAFSPDSTCFASGSDDGTIRLWDSATGASLGVMDSDGSRVISVCFSPDRIHLTSGCADGVIRIWNIPTRQVARYIDTYSDLTNPVAVTPSGRYIASGSYDGSIHFWDAQTGDAVGAPLTRHTGEIRCIALSPDGRSLVSGSADGTLCIWDLFE